MVSHMAEEAYPAWSTLADKSRAERPLIVMEVGGLTGDLTGCALIAFEANTRAIWLAVVMHVSLRVSQSQKPVSHTSAYVSIRQHT